MGERLDKGLNLLDNEVKVIAEDEEFYQLHIIGSNNEIYEVTYDDGFIYCDCPDYDYRNHQESGSFLCKHCIKALEVIFKLIEIDKVRYKYSRDYQEKRDVFNGRNNPQNM